jgi:hypothetical protein
MSSPAKARIASSDSQNVTIKKCALSPEEHGFGVFPEVLLPHETRQLIDDLDQSPPRRSRAGVRHALRHPSVAALAREPRLLNIAQEVLGAEALPFRATRFDKSPLANWLVVWHQDLPCRFGIATTRRVGGRGP